MLMRSKASAGTSKALAQAMVQISVAEGGEVAHILDEDAEGAVAAGGSPPGRLGRWRRADSLRKGGRLNPAR